MKLWPILAYLGTCAALYLILRVAQPERALVGTLVYAWNPLVTLEAVQNGHNDVVAALPSLVAVWLASTGRFRAAFPLLAVGALVKPLAPLLGPLLLVEALRRGRGSAREALIGMLLAGVLVVLAWAPFWQGLETLQGLERETIFDASPAALLLRGLQALDWSSDAAMAMTRTTVRGLSLLLYAGIMLALWSGRLSLPAAALAAFLAYLLVAAQWFNPWYLLWLVPFAALVRERWLRVVALTFALLAPLTYPFQHDARALVPAVFLPVAVLALGGAVGAWRGRLERIEGAATATI
jgi:alpha-1,6-mannosyltransferase